MPGETIRRAGRTTTSRGNEPSPPGDPLHPATPRNGGAGPAPRGRERRPAGPAAPDAEAPAGRILLVEDYPPVLASLRQGLSEAGFTVTTAADGEAGLGYALSRSFDLVILDLMLPRTDGLTVLRALRQEGNRVQVLILTARDSLEDRVRGLDLGADDYLVKPFAFQELLARVRALLRRSQGSKPAVIRVEDLEIDTCARSVRRAGRPIRLSAREYDLLEFLASRANRVVSRAKIWDHLYDFAAERNSNVVDVFIGYLRRKLEEGGLPRLIHTRRGAGYLLGRSD